MKQFKPVPYDPYQSQITYTRRFNQLKTKLKDHFGDTVEFHDTAILRWGMDACVIAHDGSLGFEMWFRDNEGKLTQTIQIAKTPDCNLSGLIGIVVRDTNFDHILDQIDVALRDNFESIYIRSLAKG